MTATQGFILHPLFLRLGRELGYTTDMGKYFSMLKMVHIHWQSNAILSNENLYDVCRFLLCEKEQDEFRFKQIFDEVYKKEVFDYLAALIKFAQNKEPDQKTESFPNETNEKAIPNDNRVIKNESTPNSPNEQEDEGQPVNEPWQAKEGFKHMNLNAEVKKDYNKRELKNEFDFLLTDDYHSISFREMIQSWRYFRLRRKKGVSNNIDIIGTVKRIAAEGGLSEPVFNQDYANRDDALLILADRKGSMTPFHLLTDSLIRTARKDGGHEKAMVYYFQNYPLEYVYQTQWMTDPIILDAVLNNVSKEHTYVLVISDAGAARGNKNYHRIDSTGVILQDNKWVLREGCFFEKLLLNVKDCVWLNPMPRERWRGTSAAVFATTEGIKMHSVFDASLLGFTNAIKDLLNEN